MQMLFVNYFIYIPTVVINISYENNDANTQINTSNLNNNHYKDYHVSCLY